MASAVRWLALPCVATSVAVTMATPRAEPHCRLAVSSALAVPSEQVATGPRVPASEPPPCLRRETERRAGTVLYVADEYAAGIAGDLDGAIPETIQASECTGV
jgi:hypothetical protein